MALGIEGWSKGLHTGGAMWLMVVGLSVSAEARVLGRDVGREGGLGDGGEEAEEWEVECDDE